MSFTEILVGCVVFLFSASNPPQPIGTGFIVQYPCNGIEGRFFPIIITANHVIADRDKVLVRFNLKNQGLTSYVRYDIPAMKRTNDFWNHPDEGVDIVAFRSLHYEVTSYIPLPFDSIASKEIFKTEDIKETDRIVFPSLLINFMGRSQNYPVIRNGTIALIPSEKVPLKYKVGQKEIETKQEVIFVDATSIPGASGSPIFLFPGPRIKNNSYSLGGKNKAYLLGVMHGFYHAIPRELIEVETTETKPMFSENSGIAIIFPSWRLLELFQNEDFNKRINELSNIEKEKLKNK